MHADSIHIQIIEAWPDAVRCLELCVAAGSTLGEVLALPQVLALWPDAASRRVGVFSRLCAAGKVLRDGDRIELYRPLIADAKAARRVRAGQSGPA